jgi:hypothetical protein
MGSALLVKHSGDEIKTKEMRWACGMYRTEVTYTQALVEKPEGNRPLGRPRRRWENNIKIIFKK